TPAGPACNGTTTAGGAVSATTAVRVTGGTPSAKSTSPPNPGCRPGPPPADASTTSAIAVRSDTSGVVVIGCGCPATVTAIGPSPLTTSRARPSSAPSATTPPDGCAHATPAVSRTPSSASTAAHRALLGVGIDDDIVRIATPGVVERATAS